jgi:S-adenosylmethionine decarboxylase|tara:strand:+ start:375 stop:743 length:369 start_codon:yes stop_codon:yes gene_type:complete
MDEYYAHKSGSEISCVMHGIKSALLKDTQKLKQILFEGLKKDKFTVLNSVEHEFEPQGYTAVVLLSESHAAIHTYPEHNSLYFHLHSCRGSKDGEEVVKYLKEKLKPKSVDFFAREIVFTKK